MRFPRLALPTLAVACLATAAVQAAGGGDDPVVRKELAANYAKVSAAYKQKKLGDIEAMMAPDFIGVDRDGRGAPKGKVLSDIKGQMMGMQDINWRRTITHLTVGGGGSTATTTVDGHMTALGKDQRGKLHKLELTATSEDQWIKIAHGWKLHHSKVLKSQMKIDGKMNPTR